MSGQPPPGRLLEVGRVGKPHGVRGDVFVTFTSDVEQRRREGARLWTSPDPMGAPLVVASVRPQGDRHVVHFDGVDSREAAALLTNRLLHAEPVDEPGALWVHTLIGSVVVDRGGDRWGRCVAVVDNPAHDLLELDDGVLVPVPFVVESDGEVTLIDPPEGLRQLPGAR